MFERRFVDIFASGFGSGYSPFASGTVGTVVAVVLFAVLFLVYPAASSLSAILGISVLLCIFAVWISERACQLHLYGFSNHDPKQVVIDEIAGYSFALIAIPPTALNLTLAFFLFRFFDVLKPPPLQLP